MKIWTKWRITGAVLAVAGVVTIWAVPVEAHLVRLLLATVLYFPGLWLIYRG